MFEVRFPRDVRKYKEKILLGLTLRQLIFTIIGLAVGVPIYIWGKKYMPEDLIAWITMIIIGIFFAFGWGSIDGLTIDKYLYAVWESNIKKPKKRYYMSKSPEENNINQEIEDLKKELNKIDKKIKST